MIFACILLLLISIKSILIIYVVPQESTPLNKLDLPVDARTNSVLLFGFFDKSSGLENVKAPIWFASSYCNVWFANPKSSYPWVPAKSGL